MAGIFVSCGPLKRALLTLLILCSSTPSRAQENLVVIVIDQLTYWATDPAQRAPLDLPNLDALAAQGRRYSRAYATSPVCSENRLALLSGQYPFSLGTNKLAPGTPSLGTLLQAAGWETGYIGKWHLSPEGERAQGLHPQFVEPANRPGWETFAGKEGRPHRYFMGKSFRQSDPTPISTAPWEPAWNTAEAVRFLRAEHERPFALVVNYGPPHPSQDNGMMPAPIFTAEQIQPRPNVESEDRLDAQSRIAAYLSKVALTDHELGVLFAEIDLTTTFVLLTSDHGEMLLSHGLPSELQKRRPWQEAARIPLLLAGPGIERGEEAALISTVDLLPSILSLLEVPLPQALQGRAFPSSRAVYFGHDDDMNSWEGERWRGLVDGAYKYAVTESGAVEVLFDLEADPYELSNLAGDLAHEARLKTLREAIRERARAVGDEFFET